MNILFILLGLGLMLDGFGNIVFFHKFHEKYRSNTFLLQLGRAVRGFVGLLVIVIFGL